MTESKTGWRFSAWVTLALFGIWVVASVITLFRGAHEYEVQASLKDYTNGKAASYTEDWFKEHLIWEPHATGFWGALRYSLFNTGNKGVLIGEEGWLYTREEYELPKTALAELEKKQHYIRTTKDYLAKQGSQLLVVMLPSKARIYPEYLPHPIPKAKAATYETFINTLKQHNVSLLDASHVLLEAKEAGTITFLKTDTHWTPEGARRVAQAVAGHLSDAEYDKLSTSMERSVEPALIDGDLLRFIPVGNLKGMITPNGDLISNYKLEQEAAEGGLFGDVAIPFALVGTSYSAIDDWHFDNFLKAALQADVLNVADEGQGPFVPMQAYLQGIKDGKKAEPYVIWEIPERFITTEYDVDFSSFEVK